MNPYRQEDRSPEQAADTGHQRQLLHELSAHRGVKQAQKSPNSDCQRQQTCQRRNREAPQSLAEVQDCNGVIPFAVCRFYFIVSGD